MPDDPHQLPPGGAPREPANEWAPPQKGDRIIDGDSDIAAPYPPPEDPPVPPAAPVRWGALALAAIGLIVLLLIAVALSR